MDEETKKYVDVQIGIDEAMSINLKIPIKCDLDTLSGLHSKMKKILYTFQVSDTLTAIKPVADRKFLKFNKAGVTYPFGETSEQLNKFAIFWKGLSIAERKEYADKIGKTADDVGKRIWYLKNRYKNGKIKDFQEQKGIHRWTDAENQEFIALRTGGMKFREISDFLNEKWGLHFSKDTLYQRYKKLRNKGELGITETGQERRTFHKWTDEQNKQLLELVSRGLSYKEISDFFYKQTGKYFSGNNLCERKRKLVNKEPDVKEGGQTAI